MSPRGTPLTQARVRELAAGPGALIVCGRFEGVDERVIEARSLEEISVGDYVLSGGELAAMVLLDAVVRLLPGSWEPRNPGRRRVSDALAFFAGPLMGAVAGFLPSRDDVRQAHFYRQALADLAARDAWRRLARGAAAAARADGRATPSCARSTAWPSATATCLQWTTAAAAQAQAHDRLAALLRRHWAVAWRRRAARAALMAAGTPRPRSPVPVPALGRCRRCGPGGSAGRGRRAATMPCSAADRDYLLGIARDTWRLFERCVGAEDHHLPPDNLQTAPHDMVAHRTSPTNIGLYLLATMLRPRVRLDRPQELLDRLEATLASLQTLPRHRGHFLNWYDTAPAQPLLPQYVSSVDSGNLCMPPARGRPGLPRARGAARRRCGAAPRAGPLEGAAAPPCAPPEPAAPSGALAAVLDADPLASCRRRSPKRSESCCDAALAELLAWLPESSAAAPIGARRARTWPGRSRTGSRPCARPCATAQGPDDSAARLRCAVAATCERLAREADFSFLYHRKRRLFHIGFRVAEQQLDAGFYDLLASEARLTSLLGDRQGRRAGGALGRARTAALRGRRAGGAALLVGLDVRVPDAAAGARRAARQRAARCRAKAAVEEQIAFAPAASRALGHLRIGLRRQRPHARLPVRAAGRAARWRCAARRPTSW